LQPLAVDLGQLVILVFTPIPLGNMRIGFEMHPDLNRVDEAQTPSECEPRRIGEPVEELLLQSVLELLLAGLHLGRMGCALQRYLDRHQLATQLALRLQPIGIGEIWTQILAILDDGAFEIGIRRRHTFILPDHGVGGLIATARQTHLTAPILVCMM
jgi:hypothetical protein